MTFVWASLLVLILFVAWFTNILGLPGNWLNAAAAPVLSERMAHYLKNPEGFGPGVTISFGSCWQIRPASGLLLPSRRNRCCLVLQYLVPWRLDAGGRCRKRWPP